MDSNTMWLFIFLVVVIAVASFFLGACWFSAKIRKELFQVHARLRNQQQQDIRIINEDDLPEELKNILEKIEKEEEKNEKGGKNQ